jgi:sugar/nucleoside kinase (ribokinase family)
MPKLDVVILGHFAKDIIIVGDKKEISSGGSVYYGSVPLKKMGLEVGIITKLNENDFSRLYELTDLGIAIHAISSNVTSGIENTYFSENREERKCKPIGFAGKFAIDDIHSNLTVKYFIIGPIMAGEVDLPLLNELHEKFPNKLCLDVQGFVRIRKNNDLIFEDWNEKAEGLKLITILKADRTEIGVLTGISDIELAAKELSKFGPKEILITHENGASVFASREFFQFPWKNKSLEGRTGRGDTCFASYVGKRISSNPKESLKFSTALTSLKMEEPGAFKREISNVNALIEKEYQT